MYSKSKAGHIGNLSNFDQLVAICRGYKTNYNPPKTLMEVLALVKISDDVKLAIDAVTQKEISMAKTSNDRELAFNGIKKLSTRILLAAKACMVTPVHYNDLFTIHRKIQGRKSAKVIDDIKKDAVILNKNLQNSAAGEEGSAAEVKKRINSNQQSYIRIQNLFGTLIEVLKATPEYNPNEADLKITALESKLALLVMANELVLAPQVDLVNARLERNQLMYLNGNNLVDTALLVKSYIRSVYGARSVQNKNLSNLKFSKPSFN